MAVLKATRRGDLGTHRVRALRKQGRIPGIIYGHGKESVPVTISQHDMEVALLHGERLLELDLEGQSQNVLVKEVQYDAMGRQLLHVDLARVNLDELVTVTVKISLRGTPAGIEEGGMLQQSAAEAAVECMVRSIPEEIRISVSHMKIGDTLYMRDLPLSEGTTLKSDPNTSVCTVTMMAEAVPAPAAEAPAQPEVIGEKKEEGEVAEEA